MKSKLFIAGEPVAQFMKRETGYCGCWVCSSTTLADTLQRGLKASACRRKRKVQVHRMPAVRGDLAFRVVIAELTK